MKCSWREGNKIQLLENGEQYYPAVFKAIGEAQEHAGLKRKSCWMATVRRISAMSLSMN